MIAADMAMCESRGGLRAIQEPGDLLLVAVHHAAGLERSKTLQQPYDRTLA
jgi:hypothetical protein